MDEVSTDEEKAGERNDLEDLLKLVRRAQKGDKNSLVELVMRRKDQLYRIAYSYMGEEQSALDMMQETIVNAFHSIEKLRQPEHFYLWYTRILINNCKDNLRRGKRVTFLNEFKERRTEDPSWSENWLDIKQGLKRLNEEYREVIIMRYMEDLPIKEIAQILGYPEGTVKSRLHYGLKALRKYVGEKEGRKNEM